jgi:hypothetical protein
MAHPVRNAQFDAITVARHHHLHVEPGCVLHSIRKSFLRDTVQGHRGGIGKFVGATLLGHRHRVSAPAHVLHQSQNACIHWLQLDRGYWRRSVRELKHAQKGAQFTQGVSSGVTDPGKDAGTLCNVG